MRTKPTPQREPEPAPYTVPYHAIYARYSTNLQNERSIEDQVRVDCDGLQRRGGDMNKVVVFADKAMSGVGLDRPDFERLMAEVRAGHVIDITVEDTSRLSRDFADSANLYRELRFRDVPLYGVIDGIDTSNPNSKVAFALKSVMNEQYVDELRKRVTRGLEGRLLKGHAYGSVPTGYSTEAVRDARGEEIARRVVIDEGGAEIVRRVFREYRDGRSYQSIAAGLNKDGIPSPHVGSRHTGEAKLGYGWGPGTIRWMLNNERYRGLWQWKKTKNGKHPGTNKRYMRPRDPSEWLSQDRPELVLVEPELWAAVHERMVDAHKRFDNGARKGGVTFKRSPYLFSGLIVCRDCGAPMQILGHHPRNFYKCRNNKVKGHAVCANKITIREDVLRPKVLAAIRDHLLSAEGTAHLRTRAEQELGGLAKKLETNLKQAKATLTQTERKLANVGDYIANGRRSAYLDKQLAELEALATQERATVAELEHSLAQPLRLPTIEEIEAQVRKLDERLMQDPATAKEQLRRWLKDGAIRVGLKDGAIVAEIALLPMVILVDEYVEKKRRKQGASRNSANSDNAMIYGQNTCDRWMLACTMRKWSRRAAISVAARIAAYTSWQRRLPMRGSTRHVT